MGDRQPRILQFTFFGFLCLQVLTEQPQSGGAPFPAAYSWEAEASCHFPQVEKLIPKEPKINGYKKLSAV